MLCCPRKIAIFYLLGHQCNPPQTCRVVYLGIINSQCGSDFNLINPNLILSLHHDKFRKINWFYTYITDENLPPYSYYHLIPVLLLKSPCSLFLMGFENKKIQAACTNMNGGFTQ